MREYRLNGRNDLREEVSRDFPGRRVIFDESLTLPASYLSRIREGSKRTTIKFSPDAIRLPRRQLPAVEKRSGLTVGRVSYRGVVVKQYSELTEEDAQSDGFETLRDLRMELEAAYGAFAPESLLSIHQFERWENA
ncbi:MAG: ASCH domain-containing protein [Candidatus Aenigmarchaeota archaeon]|nr:ASCH domain-containing protein [Candidatus Aenigmarchaeota archaeon]